MSSIDQRIVEMQFDNKQFENGIQTSMKSLDNLKKTLNFDGASKSLSNLEKAGKNFSLSGMTSGLQAVANKFTALEVIGFTALQNLTNDAINAGKRITSALTIDNVAAGWSKFGDKTTSVATLVSQGYDLDTVNEQLERLNWFTDETSYNFTDMVSNIAKFTATGQKLEPSVTAMEGIANWAALSGQNAVTASQAMYQLSQAMGKGALKYDDYKSIQNASMDTQEFRMKCLDAAVALGTLKKVGEDTYSVIGAESHTFGINQFTEYLSTDAWLTSDVMMNVFKQYSAAVDQIYEYSQEKGITTSQAIEELGNNIDEFGLKAFKSAQEARTWGDVIDSVKDAVSTGWMHTFELIFGNYEQATALWTDMANAMYDIFAEPINQMNEVLEGGLSSPTSILGIDKINPKDLGLDATEWQQFQELLTGVAREHGVAIDKMIEDEGGFSQTLKNGWLSSDLLDEALNKLRNLDTDTVVQNLDEVREAALRVIKGDYGNDMEARFAKLSEEGLDPQVVQTYVNVLRELTDGTFEFSDATFEAANAQMEASGIVQVETQAMKELKAISEQTDAPLNKVLDSISKPSGRELLIESFKNAFEALSQVIGSIKDGFRDIFPPMTSEKLYSLLEGFNEFTKSLILSDECLEKIKTASAGFFAVINIGIQAISALARGFMNLLGYLSPVGDMFLDIAEAVGNFGISLNESVKNSKIFKKGISKIGEVFEPVGEKVKSFIELVKKPFLELSTVGSPKGLTTYIEVIGNLFTSLKNKLNGFKVFIEPLSEALGNAFSSIKNAISNLKFEDVLKAINTGLVGAVLFKLKNFFGSLSDISEGFNVLENIKEILGGVKDAIESWTSSIKAKTLLTIAGALGILTVSLLALSSIDSDKLGNSLLAMTVMFAELSASMKVLDSSMKLSSVTSVGKTAVAMISLSSAILILSFAMKKLSVLDWEGIAKGLVTVSALSGILIASSKLLSSSSGGLIKASTGFIALSVALLVMSKAISKFGSMDTDVISKGLISIGGILTELAIFTKLTKSGGMGLTKNLGLIALAEAINILSKSVQSFGNMDDDAIKKGLASIGGVLTELAIFTKLTGNAKHVISTGIGLTAIAASMIIFSKSMQSMGSMSWESIGKGLSAMAGSLVSISAAMNLMPKGSVTKSLSVLVIAKAITTLGKSLKSVGSMSWESMGKGLTALGSALGIIAVAMKFMNASISGSTSLLILSGALNAIVPVLKALGSLSIGQIGTALLSLAGVFGVLGVSAALLSPLIPALLGLSAALALIGVAVGAVGVGILALSTGLTGLAVAGESLGALGSGIIDFFESLIIGLGKGLALAISKIGEFVVNAASYLQEHGPEIWEKAKQLGLDILTALGDGLLFVGDKLSVFISNVISYLQEHGPEIFEFVLDLGKAMITALGNGLLTVGEKIAEFVTNVVSYLQEHGPEIIAKALDLGKSMVTAIGNGLLTIAEKIVELTTNIGSAIMEYGPEVLAKALDLGKSMVTSIGIGLLTIGEKIAEFVGNLVSSLAENAEAVWNGAVELAGYLIDGLVNGITGGIQSVVDGVVELGSSALTALKDFLGIASPSKEFKQLGEYSSEGFAEGVTKDTDSITEALTSMASTALEALNGKIGEFASAGTKLASSMSSGMKIGILQASATSLSLITLLSQQINQKAETFNESGTNLIKGLISGIESLKGLSTSTVNSLIAALISKINENVANFTTSGATLIQGLISGMESKKSSLLSTMTSMFSSIKSSLSSLSSDFTTSGQNMMQGLINGINSKASEAINAARNAARQMLSATKDELGIHSPSKEYEKVGFNIIAGLTNGLSNNSLAIEAMTDTLQTMTKNTTKYLDIINKGIDKNTIADGLKSVTKNITEKTDRAQKSIDRALNPNGMELVESKSIDMSKKLKDLFYPGSKSDEKTDISSVVDLSELRSGSDSNTFNVSGSNTFNLSGSLDITSSKKINDVMGYQYSYQDTNKNTNKNKGVEYGFGTVSTENISYENLSKSIEKAIEKLKVVMDTGKVVGQIENPMYDSFQIMTGYKERGI